MDTVTGGYPDSVDSSPRSRGGESWDEPFPSSAAAANSKLRLMCSYGGRIVPRPTDKSLCYLGGETRIVVVDRHSSLSDLSSKLSRSLLSNKPFSLKYQLPNEDLDSLISVTTDEDLDNMIEEYDRIISTVPSGVVSKSSRLRLFLFASKSESTNSSIGSLLDDSKSENWFVDALNGAMGLDGLPRGSTDSASVNCLLGLEDDSSVHSKGGGGIGKVDPDQGMIRPASDGKIRQQDVHSVPDSPMLETTSSFGSASSAPCLSNLPPIRVRADERMQDQRFGVLDEHFNHMNLNAGGGGVTAGAAVAVVQRQEEVKVPVTLPNPTISPSENANRGGGAFGSDDEKPVAPQQPQFVVQKPAPIEAAPISESNSRPVYYQEQKREMPVSEQNYRMQPVMQPAMAAAAQEQMQMQQQQQQQQQHAQMMQQQQHPQMMQQQQHPQMMQQPQYVPMQSYYQVPHPIQQQQQQFDQQIPMYYVPIRQTAAPIPTPAAVPLPKVAAKPEIPPSMYRTAAPPAPLIQVADQGHSYTMNYHPQMHQYHPSQTAANPPQMSYGYEYTTAADVAHPQVYYTQTTSPPSMPAMTLPPQYQTVVSEQQQQGEVKQNRAS